MQRISLVSPPNQDLEANDLRMYFGSMHDFGLQSVRRKRSLFSATLGCLSNAGRSSVGKSTSFHHRIRRRANRSCFLANRRKVPETRSAHVGVAENGKNAA